MKNSKIESERLLFGVLCNDPSAHNGRKNFTFEESLYSLFRTYLNNEVLRRYIVIRKILQKHSKIILFNEPSIIEDNFDKLSPNQLLDYIYPGSSSHLAYIDKSSFIKHLGELANTSIAWCKNLHFAIALDYLKGPSSSDSSVSNRQLAENYTNYQNYVSSNESNPHDTSNEDTKLVNSQNILITLPLLNLVHPDITKSFKPLLEDSFKSYTQELASKNELINIPLILSCKNQLKSLEQQSTSSEEVFGDLV